MNPADAAVQERVDRLFDRFERMTDVDFMMLRTIWDEQDAAPREEAWTIVKFALKSERRERMLDDARNRIASWVNNYSYRMASPDTMGLTNPSGMDAGSVRKAAIPPMLDAIAATITAAGLSAEQQTVLLEPLTRLAPPHIDK